MMKQANEYANALFELAREDGSAQEYLKGLRFAADSLGDRNSEIMAFLSSPGIARKERIDVLDSAFRDAVPANVLNFLKVLCESGRIAELSGCADAFQALLDAEEGVTEAEAVSAVRLNDDEIRKLKDVLEKRTHKTVRLVNRVDPGLLGGLTVTVEGKTIDGSIRHRIKALKDVMEK